MSQFWVPGQSINYVGWVPMNRQVKNAFAQSTALFLWTGMEKQDLKWLNQWVIDLLEQSVQQDLERSAWCRNCNQPYNPDCQICNGTWSQK
jgi:hypothetical protein